MHAAEFYSCSVADPSERALQVEGRREPLLREVDRLLDCLARQCRESAAVPRVSPREEGATLAAEEVCLLERELKRLILKVHQAIAQLLSRPLQQALLKAVREAHPFESEANGEKADFCTNEFETNSLIALVEQLPPSSPKHGERERLWHDADPLR